MVFVRAIAAATAAALISTSATAAGLSIRVENKTSRIVQGLSAFPINSAGTVVEDNIGGHYDRVPPGGSAEFTVTGRCGEMLLLVVFDGGHEQRAKLNSCSTRRITLNE